MQLNNGKQFSREEVYEMFQPEWDVQTIMVLLSGLLNVEGIRVQEKCRQIKIGMNIFPYLNPP